VGIFALSATPLHIVTDAFPKSRVSGQTVIKFMAIFRPLGSAAFVAAPAFDIAVARFG